MNSFSSSDYIPENNKSLYQFGEDRRYNLDDVTLSKDKKIGPLISKIKKQAQSIACMMFADQLVKISSDQYRLQNTTTLAQKITTQLRYPFGENESFAEEPAPGFGTAFFIGEKFALTAAHCVCLPDSDDLNEEIIKKTKLVFNFRQIKKSTPLLLLSEVYEIKKIVLHKFKKTDSKWKDWALIELDRDVVGRDPLEMGKKVAKDVQLYMLGHPCGLPIKLTKDGVVTGTKENDRLEYFDCHLDAFSGNSGSPVFDLKTQQVIGVLSSGSIDYEITMNYKNTTNIRIQNKYIEKGHERCQLVRSFFSKKIIPLIAPFWICPKIEEALNSNDFQIKMTALRDVMKLVDRNPKWACSKIEEALNSNDFQIKMAAFDELKQLGWRNPKLAQPLIERVFDDKNLGFKKNALDIMGDLAKYSPDLAFPLIERAFYDKEFDIQQLACMHLLKVWNYAKDKQESEGFFGRIKHQWIFSLIERALKVEDISVRLLACKVVMMVGTCNREWAFPLIKQLCDDTDPLIKDLAKEFLEKNNLLHFCLVL